VRSKVDYDRLKETYGQRTVLSMNTKLLLKNTYGEKSDKDSDPIVQKAKNEDA
jgi:hypothetical protein